jgi:hypothetical protein
MAHDFFTFSRLYHSRIKNTLIPNMYYRTAAPHIRNQLSQAFFHVSAPLQFPYRDCVTVAAQSLPWKLLLSTSTQHRVFVVERGLLL